MSLMCIEVHYSYATVHQSVLLSAGCYDTLPSVDFIQYTHIQSGHAATVTCPGDIPNNSVIRMCYVQGHGNSTVNQSRDCAECFAFKENNNTKCGDFPGRRDWTVARTERPTANPCTTNTVSVLTIPEFKSEDEGMVFCYASRNKNLGTRFYAVRLISEKHSYNVEIIAAVILGVVSVALVSLLLVLIARRYRRRKSMDSSGCPSAESATHEREERESDVREELPTERSHLLINYNHSPHGDGKCVHITNLIHTRSP